VPLDEDSGTFSMPCGCGFQIPSYNEEKQKNLKDVVWFDLISRVVRFRHNYIFVLYFIFFNILVIYPAGPKYYK
jgi:hypothetical protein